MNIGIVTIAYKGYGKFLPNWCRYVSQLDTKPSAVTVALGEGHGLTKKEYELCLEFVPELQVVHQRGEPNMGVLRNLAVSKTETEWIMYVSVDDAVLPHAISEVAKYQDVADYICIKWQLLNTNKKLSVHTPTLPIDQSKVKRRKGFIVNHSPYRKRFWELTPYEEHDYPNSPFIAGMVVNGARFAVTEEPCTMYIKRPSSHSGFILPRYSEKQKALYHKKRADKKIEDYYGN